MLTTTTAKYQGSDQELEDHLTEGERRRAYEALTVPGKFLTRLIHFVCAQLTLALDHEEMVVKFLENAQKDVMAAGSFVNSGDWEVANNLLQKWPETLDDINYPNIATGIRLIQWIIHDESHLDNLPPIA